MAVLRAVVFVSCLCGTALSHDCSVAGDCTEQPTVDKADILMQRNSKMGGHLQAQKKKQQAHVGHSGTVSLLLTEMNDFVAAKGTVGLDPDEIEHIHSIKALIDDTILPTVLAEVEDSRNELAALYQDIVNCEAHVGGTVNYTMEKETTTETILQKTRECEKMEDALAHKKKVSCETLNRSRLAIYGPGEEDVPPSSAPDEELIRYLHIMDEFFCGTYEVFYDEWKECETTWNNWTITQQECVKLEKEFVTSSCTWKTNIDKNCEYFDTCWTDSVKKYNERKKAILELQESRKDEYAGAASIECLWSAWIYEGQPCTVNKTRVKECHEVPPNLTNVTIEFPPPPPPPQCDTASVQMDVCGSEWIQANYGSLGLSKETFDEIKANCVPCPSYTWTSAPTVTSHTHMTNLYSIGNGNYMKTGGQVGACDAVVESDDPDVTSITVSPVDLSAKTTLEIVTADTTISIELSDSIATADDQQSVAMYHDGDIVTLSVSGGMAIYAVNGEEFYSKSLPDMSSGTGKVTICASNGVTLHAVMA